MVTTTKFPNLADALTHSGTIYGDEVMSTVILSKIYHNLQVCRVSAVPENLPPCIIVYAIGLGEFDHHQKNGNGCRENGVPYASCGLIWKKYGEKFLKTQYYPEDPEAELIPLIWEIIDHELIQGIDAMANGKMPQADYPTQILNFSQMISMFNPSWDVRELVDENRCFLDAVKFAEMVFDLVLSNATSKARAQIEEAKNA